MIGHMPLIQMRRAHKRPAAVWIWVGMDKTKWAASWHLYSDLWSHPEVTIEPDDKIKELDLRFLVNLQVHVQGNDTKDRMLQTHLACMRAGASDVFTLLDDDFIHDEGEKIAVPAA